MSPATSGARAEHAALPPVAAGVTLQQMRRRVRLGHFGVWAALAAGPIALAISVAPTPTAATAAAVAPAPAPTVHTATGADPAGYAVVFTDAWLRSHTGDESSVQARRAQSMAPSIVLPARVTDAQPLQSVTAVRSRPRLGGWSVTVAATYPDGIRYFAVPVISGRGGVAFAVTGQPAVVAGPRQAAVPESPYTVSVPPDGDLAATTSEFFSAYLTGRGGIDRYLAPGTRLDPVTRPAFTTIRVEEVTAVEGTAAAGSAPADGTTARVLVRVEAEDGSGVWPLAYELEMTVRSKRWEITTLVSAAGGASS
ncbi:conjugal transfer protein [Streptomyces sp. NPDC020681]|uniref:conjugal transfer protein n=1 Tax=Streptomyces sp. NPDC020681 TaxID=3365083 RepID=UPI0037899903